MGKSKRSDRITQFNTWYSQDIEAYKRFAENRSKATRYNQEYLTDLTFRIKDYLTQQETSKQPFTVTGLYMCLEMQKKDYYKAKKGEFDWKLYQFADFHGITFEDLDNLEVIEDDQLGDLHIWTDENGQVYIMETYSTIIERALLLIQSQIEANLYTSRNPVGCIFLLKSRFGWSDKPDQAQGVLKIPHIATRAEAEEALKSIEKPDVS